MSDDEKTYQIYFEIFFKSGRMVRAYADVLDETLVDLYKVIYSQGIGSMTSLELSKVWIEGKFHYAYSSSVREIESVSIIWINPPSEVDKPSHAE